VKAFQRYYGLSADGVAGKATFTKLSSVVNSPLQNGKKHKDTVKLKKDLETLGYGKFIGNTSYGPSTKKAVEKLQRDHKLVVNGIADEVTLKKIKSLLAKPSLPSKKVKIFIDAGHGGSDPGASGNGLKEKDLTLKIAKNIEKNLRQYKNVEIMMSRTTNKTLSLKQRTDKANSWGADFYFSVHINSYTSASANGFESFIHNSKATTSEKNKQNIIHNQIINSIKVNNIVDRGKKTANFHVLRESNMDAMLVEYLFITNKKDSGLLKRQNFIDKLGKSTADGIAKAHNLKK